MYKKLCAGILCGVLSFSVQAQPDKKSNATVALNESLAGVSLNGKWEEQSKNLSLKAQSCTPQKISGTRGVVADKICRVTFKKAPVLSGETLPTQFIVFLKNGMTVGVGVEAPISKAWTKQKVRSLVSALYEQAGNGPYIDAGIDAVIDRDAATAWYFKEDITQEGTEVFQIIQGLKGFITVMSN